MAGFRLDRISEEVRHALDKIIREMNDPRITGTYSVTRADVTRDLRYAKVYISVLESEKADEMIKALKKAAGFIRHELGARVQLRYTPELLFYRDDNIAYGVHISEILKNVGAETEDETAEGDK
ncbi:MAG: 30S ribosome-binding factor RbfA [Clostridia bacterium]|nr:30S ribosome-binding factor RbfA [Clostridia bacterium]